MENYLLWTLAEGGGKKKDSSKSNTFLNTLRMNLESPKSS